MEQVAQQVVLESHLFTKAAAFGDALWHIAQRVAGIMALLTFTYGLLAAEVELAKIEAINATASR
ncbi:MAG: hypothetical protein JWN94_330 [Betaproteobacteria bacterium]|nr:hypothetical protein [Betaproteobacteria bacterium]